MISCELVANAARMDCRLTAEEIVTGSFRNIAGTSQLGGCSGRHYHRSGSSE